MIFPLSETGELLAYCEREYGLNLSIPRKKVGDYSIEPAKAQQIKFELERGDLLWFDRMLYDRVVGGASNKSTVAPMTVVVPNGG